MRAAPSRPPPFADGSRKRAARHGGEPLRLGADVGPDLGLVGAVEAVLAALEDATFERFAAPGVGEDLRFESDALVAAALVAEGCVVHFSAFPR